MTDWVYLRHEGIDGVTRVPDDPEVVESHEVRGWTRTETPAETPSVPPRGSSEDPGQPWVELVHPGIPSGRNRVPNDPAALRGALDAGWEYPTQDQPDTEDQPASKPAKRTSMKASAKPASENEES